jgi:drug/metabolite transporter (DMT)-like permease
MRFWHVLALVVMNLFWATTYPVFKVLSQHLTSGGVATLRYGLAAVILAVLWRWLPGQGPRTRDWLRVLVIGLVVFGLAPRLQVEAVRRGQAGDTSLLVALEPLVTAVAAAIFLREHIASRRWWGFLLGMAGVVLLSNVWRGSTPLVGLLPNAMFIASFFCEATYSVAGKPLLDRTSPFKLLGGALILALPINLGIEMLLDNGSLHAAAHLPPFAWGLLVYLAVICTVVGYGLWFLVIREADVNVASLTIFVQPVTGLILSVVWLGESVHVGQLWGGLAILTGLIIGLRR